MARDKFNKIYLGTCSQLPNFDDESLSEFVGLPFVEFNLDPVSKSLKIGSQK